MYISPVHQSASCPSPSRADNLPHVGVGQCDCRIRWWLHHDRQTARQRGALFDLCSAGFSFLYVTEPSCWHALQLFKIYTSNALNLGLYFTQVRPFRGATAAFACMQLTQSEPAGPQTRTLHEDPAAGNVQRCASFFRVTYTVLHPLSLLDRGAGWTGSASCRRRHHVVRAGWRQAIPRLDRSDAV